MVEREGPRVDGDVGDDAAEEPVEDLVDEALDDNPDPQTRRETFELELMDGDRSEEGETVSLEDAAGHRDSSRGTR
jgi:hypothetical protein